MREVLALQTPQNLTRVWTINRSPAATKDYLFAESNRSRGSAPRQCRLIPTHEEAIPDYMAVHGWEIERCDSYIGENALIHLLATLSTSLS